MNKTQWFRALIMAVCACFALSLLGVGATCEAIEDTVIRLHVLAASDSEEDQRVKLLVRDAVLRQTQALCGDATDKREDVLKKLQDALASLEKAANDCLKQNGSSHTAKAMICTMSFPRREYDTVTLPAGRYEALRIVIGEGKGQNWWCVVFPPLCVTGACDPAWEDVLTASQQDVLTHPEKYRVRLKVLEWISALKSS